MTFEQASLLILLVVMLILFSLDRFRIEVVAIAGLLAGYALGLYPSDRVFSGFASPVVMTVIEILLVVQVLARARLFDRLAGFFSGAKFSRPGIIATLSSATGFISIFMNNIGAFSIALPVALRVSATMGLPRRQLIMPISFAALLGGLVSLIGTPANLLVSDALTEATGSGFRLFDFAYVGLPVAIAGIALAAWLAPRLFNEADDTVVQSSGVPRRWLTERQVPQNSPLVGTSLSLLPARFGLQPHALLRNDRHVFGSPDKSLIESGDTLLVEADAAILVELLASGALLMPRPDAGTFPVDVDYAEAVVMPESTVVGSRIHSLEIFSNRSIRVTALSLRSPRIEGRFRDQQLSIGDILVLEGDRAAIAEALEECECLPLAAQPPPPSSVAWQPFAIFACGVAATAFELASPEIAFAAVVLALAIGNYLNIRQAMADLNWPIIIMLGAMIPIGSAVASTGTAEVIAGALSSFVPIDEPLVAIALLLFLAMALTPFVNNATVAIILGPVALEFAGTGHHAPQAYLIAVAAGASLDFLTPFGHHNNTLAMGIGGYRFTDFLRAGGPLAITSYVFTVLLIYVFWL